MIFNLSSPDDLYIAPQKLTSMFQEYFSQHISVVDGLEKRPLPEWAASLIWLGAWCRSCQLAGKRLIVVAVLPTRELAAAFASFGCLVAGARMFEDALSWPLFKKLPTGRRVYWGHRNATGRYAGEIIGFKESEGTEFIVVKVTKARRQAEVGYMREISRSYFDDYRFTEEKPPTVPKAASVETAQRALESLVVNLNPKWIWADGAEGLLVTSLAKFDNSIEGLSLSVDGKSPVAFSDMLCLGRNREQMHAKLRIDHPRGTLGGNFPLAILDGSNSFMEHEHLGFVPNILVILDRSEYQNGIHDKVLELRSISQDIKADFMSSIPGKIVAGIELAAYLIDGQ